MGKADTAQRPTVGLQLRAAFAPATYDASSRSVELTWSTGADVPRSSWDGDFVERLSLAPGAVRLERLNAGAPLLNSHASYDLADVIGVVERAWLAGNQGHAVVRFSDRPEVEPIVQDVKNGILRNISVGYKVHRWETTPPSDSVGVEIRTAIDWEPYELSLVPIPADAGAQVRSDQTIIQGDNMKTQTINIDNTDHQTRAERQRAAGILDCARRFEVSEDFARKLIEQGVSQEEAEGQIIDARSAEERRTPGIARVEVAEPGAAGQLQQLQQRFLARLNHERDGISTRELLEAITGRRGQPDELLQRVMSTSDFAALLGNVISGAAARFLRERYSAAGTGARQIAKRRESLDLRDIALLGLSEFPALQKLGEGGEITYGDFTDRGGSYRIEEYARGVKLTRRALLTDQLGAFDEALSSYGRAIAALEDQLVIDALEAGANGAKCLEDNKALFDASHGNTTTETGLDVPALAEAAAKLRSMKETGNGRALNLAPRWLLVPAALEVQALQLTTAIAATESSSVNPFAAGRLALEPIVDANLSGSHAYVLADPAGPAAAIELCSGPAVADVQTMADFDSTSVKTRVLADRGLGVRDHRGIIRIALGS